MKYYTFAISKGFGTLLSHGVSQGWPHEIKSQGETIIAEEITQAEYEAFGPNRVPQ
jgi:hypothetical protein